jgi:hypothetical protein
VMHCVPRGVIAKCHVIDAYADEWLTVEQRADTEEKARNAIRWELRRQIMARGVPLVTTLNSFEQAAGGWLKAVERCRAPRTVKTYAGRLAAEVYPSIGTTRLRDLDAPRLALLFASFNEWATPRQARDVRFIVTSVLGFAVRHGALPENPVYGIVEPAESPLAEVGE